MSAKVLKSFLIGIGYDTKGLEAGEKKISGSLQGLKGRALQVSGALVGAFSAGAASVAATARSVDQLALSTQNLRTSTNAVYNYGNAIRLAGGEAGEALDAVTRFEEIQNNLRLKGDAGPITELATAGIDVNALYQTDTGEEFLRTIAEMIPRLDEGQRAQVQSSLGLSDAAFRSLAGGVEKLDASIAKANSITGNIDQLSENSRRLLESSAELGLAVEGVRNELAEKFLPSLIGASNWLNKLINDHRDDVSGVIDYAAENAGATAALGAASAASVAGAVVSKLGLNTVGGAVSKAGGAGVAVTGSAIGANLLNRTLDEHLPGYGDASRAFDELLMGITGASRIPGPLELMFGGPSAAPSKEWPNSRGPDTYSGEIIRSQEDVDYLNQREPLEPELERRHIDPSEVIQPARQPPSEASRQAVDYLKRRDAGAADSMPPLSVSTIEEDRQASAEAIAGALVRSPIKVQSQLGVTLMLDGQALETKIVQVNERTNYETLADLRVTTER